MNVEEILTIIGDNTPNRARLAFQTAKSHQVRLAAVEHLIDFFGLEMTKTRQLRQGRSEDELTQEIVSWLVILGFYASHDKQFGGHCDITIEGRDDFLWIGEAKKHGAYDWLVDGYAQLFTRYSTGMPGQDAGEVIVYAFVEDLNNVMETWAKRLRECRPAATVTQCDENSLIWRSVEKHPVSGLDFRTRLKGISLYFKPEK